MISVNSWSKNLSLKNDSVTLAHKNHFDHARVLPVDYMTLIQLVNLTILFVA